MQAQARAFLRRWEVEPRLEALGRVVMLGSFRTGLMVWPDLDVGVDAPVVAVEPVFSAVFPLLATPECTALEYANETAAPPQERRFYFVLRLAGWKLDISVWTGGVPPGVEAWQETLPDSLDAEARLAILRLKDHWYRLPPYPYTVGGYEISVAVLEHGVRTLDELDAYLAQQGLPTRAG